MSTSQQPNVDFVLQRVYTKDVSFESPHSPKIFLEKWEAEPTLHLENSIKKLDENVYDVTLEVTIKVKLKDKTAFLIELQQAGIFTILKPFKEEPLKNLLAIKCPESLYPYARASISHLIMQGGFPAFDLPPMDFTSLYHQNIKNKQLSEAG
jgi:preprotein translocase subunit SecB